MYDAQIDRWHVPDPIQEHGYAREFEKLIKEEIGAEGYKISEDNLTEGKQAARDYFNMGIPKNVLTPESSAVHYNSSPYAYVLNNPMKYIDLLGLDTTWHELPAVTVTAKAINLWGPGLILLGNPFFRKDGPIVKYFFGKAFAAGKHRSTSAASIILRKTIPSKVTTTKVLGKKAGNWVAKKAVTKALGGVLGRLVPYAGWAACSGKHGMETGLRVATIRDDTMYDDKNFETSPSMDKLECVSSKWFYLIVRKEITLDLKKDGIKIAIKPAF